ncbi:hypothetical protein HMPREF9332_01738 [Alloprevotella rava F0323]|uniref:DUF1460 domain-containing protein n=2 Tax=Alloprevotella rava TaxID=671218 RepID=G5GDT6_9BACT|nr:hypothetical protein HMPREF9332_01738 [Alloprevotella rava F0323]
MYLCKVENLDSKTDMKFILLMLLSFLAINCNGTTKNSINIKKEETEKNIKEITSSSNTYDLTKVVFSPQDSIKIVELLSSPAKGNDILWFARKFINIPYVASTLEIADPEQLVVNLTQLDCTTLVETVLALAITQRKSEKKFTDYCQNLELIRYNKGKMDGYLSRNHYFSWWMHDNMNKGIIKDITDTKYFTANVNVQNYYMSQNPSKYKFLKAHPEWGDSIRTMEKSGNGPDGSYLPEKNTCLSKKELSVIHDGDIIAIVTTKKGIDYSHLGFAVWGKDGKLHLLNASSIHHKVVEEPKTLYQYLKEHPSSIGIRVLRLKKDKQI